MRSAGHVPVKDGAVQVGRPRSPQSPDYTGGAVERHDMATSIRSCLRDDMVTYVRSRLYAATDQSVCSGKDAEGKQYEPATVFAI